MKAITAHCGLACNECDAFVATKENNMQKKIETAESWSKMYQVEIKPEDIICKGCLHDGPEKFGHCLKCEIRKCSTDKQLENCGYCIEYPCNKLSDIFKFSPDAKTRLDKKL